MNDETRPPSTSRRTLLLGAASLAPLPLTSLAQAAETLAEHEPEGQRSGPYQLPPLPYPYHALEPHIDARTMRIHHGKHHAAYVNNLNERVFSQAPDLANMSPEELIRSLDRVPEALRDLARNNGGGHVNHTMFWRLMRPRGGGSPTGPVAAAIRGAFGDFETLRQRFNEAGERRFGSGWVWLVRTPANSLEIVTTPNQDNPLMDGRGYPVLGNDVWEHAYYLKYQNRRADYLKAWWNVVDWVEVNRRFVEGGR